MRVISYINLVTNSWLFNKSIKIQDGSHSCTIFLATKNVCVTLSNILQKKKKTSTTINMPHYSDVIMTTIASKITSLGIVYSTVYSGADQSKHQSSASLVFVRAIHRGPVNSPHKGPVTRKMFPFDDVIMQKQAVSDCCMGICSK